MSVVAGVLLPGSPLPLLAPDNPPWTPLVEGMERAGAMLADLGVDVIAVYSTQWVAVLDQLWQTRPLVEGVHVDETWHEYGEIEFSLRVDREFAEACIGAAGTRGLRSRSVDYDAFPIDTGTLVASRFLDPQGTARFAMTSNNLYHDAETTRAIGAVVREVAAQRDTRVAAVGVGGLSGSLLRGAIDIASDHIAGEGDDRWNRRVLELLEAGDRDTLEAEWGAFAEQARAEMGFKHFAFLQGALGGHTGPAEILAYGPTHGAGAAVATFRGE